MNALLSALVQSLGGGQGGQLQGGATEDDRQLEYYTNPQSEGYYEQVWGCICRRCEGMFALSAAEINENRFVSCPNCRAMNNPAQAHRDYRYMRERNQSRLAYPSGYPGQNAYDNSPFGNSSSTSTGGTDSYSYGGGPGYTSSNRPGAGYRWKIGASDD